MNKVLQKNIFLFVMLCFITVTASAQNEEIEKEIQETAKQRVSLFCEYITTIADKKENLQNRLHYCKQALSLFIGKGNSYPENGITRKGVVMEVSSLTQKNADGTPKVTPRLMKNYLNGLANLRYARVNIKHTDIAKFKITALKRHPTEKDMWVCTVGLEQYFEGYNGDGILKYYDKTTKWITVYVKVEEFVDPINGGTKTEYRVMLGDVKSEETTNERLN